MFNIKRVKELEKKCKMLKLRDAEACELISKLLKANETFRATAEENKLIKDKLTSVTSPEVKTVYCGKTETVVLFTDGDKVSVRRSKGTKDDRATAVMYAYVRKATGKSKSQLRRWAERLLEDK